nr:CRISPR-associated helicase Cas3' [Actinomyces sp. B33]
MTDSELSERTRSFWAKSGRRNPEEWLSVPQHLMDACDVAGRLFDDYASPHQRRLMASVWKGDEGAARAMLGFLAGLHDAGKISLEFSCQVPSLAQFIRDHGIDVPHWRDIPDRGQLPHGFVTHFALVDAIAAGGGDRRRAEQWAAIAGVHHGRYPNPAIMDTARRMYNIGPGCASEEPEWARARGEVIEWMARRTGFPLVSEKPTALPELPVAVAAAYASLVVMSDWLASNEQLFPLLHQERRHESMSPGAQRERIEAGWAKARIPAPLRLSEERESDIARRYRRRFEWNEGISPTRAQIRAVQIAEAEDPDLMIVEAPTGSGKTELAFLVAEAMIRRRGLQGVMIALPTQATTDAMFSRARRWLTNLLGEEPQALGIHLAHGKNDLNEDFVRMLDDVGDPVQICDENGSGLYASKWMAARWRATLSPVVIGTIDHVLLAALKSRHVLMRHLGLMGKVVVIDEAHAADDYMETYLESALTWLGMYGVPVVLLSATLPSDRRRALVAAYRRGRAGGTRADDVGLDGDIGYPVITTVGDEGRTVRSEAVPGGGTHVRKRIVPLDAPDAGALADFIDGRLDEGGCAAVIRNTVKEAQETYRAMAERFGEDSLTLLHSRFLACDRAAKDRLMLRMFGKSPEGRPRRHVVVATQVIEQSLDVDFDLMVTDPAPMDLILQRIGRLHRHSGRARPPGLEEAECFVLVENAESTPWGYSRGSKVVYRDHRILRTLAILSEHSQGLVVAAPEDCSALTQRAYSEDPVADGSWSTALAEAAEAERAAVNKSRDKASQWSLDSPSLPAWKGDALLGSFEGNLATGEEEQPMRGVVARAAVRDAEDQIPVIVIPIDPALGGVATGLPWRSAPGEPVMLDTSVWPDAEATREIRSWSLSLPPWQFTNRDEDVDEAITAVARALWDDERVRQWGFLDHPLLKGELVLPMIKTDEHSDALEAEVRGRRLVYTNHRGLEVQDL